MTDSTKDRTGKQSETSGECQIKTLLLSSLFSNGSLTKVTDGRKREEVAPASFVNGGEEGEEETLYGRRQNTPMEKEAHLAHSVQEE